MNETVDDYWKLAREESLSMMDNDFQEECLRAAAKVSVEGVVSGRRRVRSTPQHAMLNKRTIEARLAEADEILDYSKISTCWDD